MNKKKKKAVKKLQNFFKPYQKKFIADKTKKIICLKSRRIGMSEAACVIAINKATKNNRHDVYFVSRSYREAKELIRRATKWCKVFQQLGAFKEPKATATKITFNNQSRIIALPAKAVRSRGGTVIMDEAADIPNAEEVYQSVAPAVEADPRGQLFLISTPMGKSGLFYQVWNNDENAYSKWSRHRIDVFEAYEQGADWLPDPEKLKEDYPETTWRQEFMCEFLGSESQFFDYDLLTQARMDKGDKKGVSGYEHSYRVLGIDLGATQDASVAVLCEQFRSKDGTVQKIFLDKHEFLKEPGKTKKLSTQFAELENGIMQQYDIDAIVVDGAGLGMQFAQDLEQVHPNVVIWDTGTWRKMPEKFVPLMKKRLEDQQLFINGSRKFRDAFAAIERKVGANNRISFKAGRNNVHGHADLFWASLMAFCEIEDPAMATEFDFFFA